MTLDCAGEPMAAYFDTDDQTTEFVLTFDSEKPPLRKDDRLGRVQRAQVERHVRRSAMWEARRLPLIDGPVLVTLAWNVNDGIPRQPERMRPTLDAMLAGLVAADVLHDVEQAKTHLVVNVLDKATNPTQHLTLTIAKDTTS